MGFSESYKKEALEVQGDFLKAVNFIGEGLKLKYVGVEQKEVPNFCENLCNVYSFEMTDGSIKTMTHDSTKATSKQFAAPFIKEHVLPGDSALIKVEMKAGKDKEGKEFDFPVWHVEKLDLVDTASVFSQKQQENKEVDVNQIPFN